MAISYKTFGGCGIILAIALGAAWFGYDIANSNDKIKQLEERARQANESATHHKAQSDLHREEADERAKEVEKRDEIIAERTARVSTLDSKLAALGGRRPKPVDGIPGAGDPICADLLVEYKRVSAVVEAQSDIIGEQQGLIIEQGQQISILKLETKSLRASLVEMESAYHAQKSRGDMLESATSALKKEAGLQKWKSGVQGMLVGAAVGVLFKK